MRNYEKPHLTFEEQLERLQSRGLLTHSSEKALGVLREIGYYRFSAYTYPFRQRMGGAAGQPQRYDNFVDGAAFEHVLEIYRFDSKLRALLRDGIEILEVGLAVQIGYIAGRRGPFAHVSPNLLDLKEISRLTPDASGETLYEQWLSNYRKEVKQASGEDYVKHFLSNYKNRELPIWAATGVMSFGTLMRLYQFLLPEDRRLVAIGLGLGSQPQIKNHLLAYRTLRNHCSHGARVWNRNFTHTNPQIPSHVQDNTWDHLLHPSEPREQARLYRLAELLAYMIISIQPRSNWPRTFATLIKKFPKAEGIQPPYVQSPEWSMGFPTGWSDLPIWNYEPKRSLRK